MHRVCLPILMLSSLAMAQSGSAVVTTMPVTTRPATSQATTAPATKPAAEVTPAARLLLDRLKKAYSAESPLAVEGTIVGKFDVSGRQNERRMSVSGYANGAGRFFHEAKGIGRVVHTGERVYVYDARQNAYGAIRFPDKRQPAADVSDDAIEILIDENPSLLLTLATDPDQLLIDNAEKIDARGNDLVLETVDDIRTLRLNDEGLIQSMLIDYTPLLKRKGASEIKVAGVELTYTRIDRQAAPEGTFAFAVPSGATEIQFTEELMKERRDALQRRGRATTAPTTRATSGPAIRPITTR